MRVLALYDSRYGFSKHCLELLDRQFGEPSPVLIRSIEHPTPWEDGPWDALVLGGPLYHGHFRPNLKRFLRQHRLDLARVPRVHLFAVGLSARARAVRIVHRELSPLLGTTATKVWFFGGRLPWPELGWWDRLRLRVSRGLENEVSNLDLPEIQALAAALTKL